MIRILGPVEIFAQQLMGNIRRYALGVDSVGRIEYGIAVDVRSEDFHVSGNPRSKHALLDQDGQGIGFLTGGASGSPKPNLAIVVPAHESTEPFLLQGIKNFPVSEKTGHTDEQFSEQGHGLAGITLQVAQVITHFIHAIDGHASLDAPVHGAELVISEIHVELVTQDDENARQSILVADLAFHPLGLHYIGMPGIGHQPSRHFLGGQDKIHQPRGYGRPGHAVEPCSVLLLDHDHAAVFLNGTYTAHAVAARTRKDHGHGLFPLVFGQGAQEHVDGQVDDAFYKSLLVQEQLAVENGQVLFGGNEVNIVRLDQHAVLGPVYLHGGFLGKDFHHQALVIRRQVLDDDKSHAAVRSHSGKKEFDGLEPPGGSPNGYIEGRMPGSGSLHARGRSRLADGAE